MIEVTVEDFEKDFDDYMDRIENGEEFLIRTPDGKAVVAVPAGSLSPVYEQMSDDEWYNLQVNHNDGP